LIVFREKFVTSVKFFFRKERSRDLEIK